jgi:hypothetical protein
VNPHNDEQTNNTVDEQACEAKGAILINNIADCVDHCRNVGGCTVALMFLAEQHPGARALLLAKFKRGPWKRLPQVTQVTAMMRSKSEELCQMSCLVQKWQQRLAVIKEMARAAPTSWRR